PCLHSRTLSNITGCDVWLKFENLQFTAAFKERGAFNKLNALTLHERKCGVIAASAGNHAQGVAYHAQRLGIPATIVMPMHASTTKVERTRAFGATVVLEGRNFDEAKTVADRLASERGLVYVHPYDDDLVIAGQGTIGLEMLEAEPSLDTLVIPIGGGGLISGIAIAAHAIKPDIEIVGVQTKRFPSMWAAIHRTTAHYGASTIADGIAVQAPGLIAQGVVRQFVRDIVLVDEGDLEQAIVMLLEIEKTVVEGAAAAGLAALLCHRERFAGKRVGLVLCGGNIDPLVLAAIIERGMARSGRLARIVVALRDAPGGLAEVATRLGQLGANIDEIHHQRTFSALPMQSVEVEFVVRTRSAAHIDEIVMSLERAGFPTRRA
ncbi:MAG TPA: threonine ammonia-lyase, partial [Burkholderiaceae bacterium]|nr:threonine ammonia-lyase [Burkholderiaceae bacterium]